jgi:hypothetical protein
MFLDSDVTPNSEVHTVAKMMQLIIGNYKFQTWVDT